MTRLATFLRGINLGKRRVKMKKLRGHFEEMGLENVASFIASGNVVFDDPDTDPRKLEQEIEGHLEQALGFTTEAFVRTLADLEALVGHEVVTIREEAGFTPYIIFLRDRAGEELEEELASLETPDDRFHALGREVVWLRRGGISDTSISARDFERALDGMERTRRKLNTVRRMVKKFGD